MKRKTEPVPEFDEIIFENRNKMYGAYLIRKYYKSTTSFSILGGTILFSAIIILLAINSEKGGATISPVIGEVIKFDPVNIPQPPQDNKPPEGMKEILRNVAPVVTTDTSFLSTKLMTADELIQDTKNKDIADTIAFIPTDDNVTNTTPDPVVWVEEMPMYPGGIEELMSYVSQNLKYPEEARNLNIQGKVIIKFVVNTDGSVDRAQVVKGIDQSLDNEALRVVNSLPKFRAGRQNGIPVPVWFVMPITFKLEALN